MRQIVMTLVLALVCSATAWAGNYNPDQLDVNNSYFYSTSPRSASSNYAHVRQSGSQNRAEGEVANYDATGAGVVWWDLWEPDKVSRRPNRGNEGQRSYASVGFSTWDTGGTTWDSTTVEKCKASTKVRGTDGIPTDARWRVSCRGAFAAMGIDPAVAARLDALLGHYVNTTRDTIKISGKGPVD